MSQCDTPIDHLFIYGYNGDTVTSTLLLIKNAMITPIL